MIRRERFSLNFHNFPTSYPPFSDFHFPLFLDGSFIFVHDKSVFSCLSQITSLLINRSFLGFPCLLSSQKTFKSGFGRINLNEKLIIYCDEMRKRREMSPEKMSWKFSIYINFEFVSISSWEIFTRIIKLSE
jgi:hypothetical protein